MFIIKKTKYHFYVVYILIVTILQLLKNMILRTLWGWDKEIFTPPICRQLTWRAESLGLTLVSSGLPRVPRWKQTQHLQIVFQRRSLNISKCISTVSGIPSFPFLFPLNSPTASTAFPPHQDSILVASSLIWLLLSLPEGGCERGLSTTRMS